MELIFALALALAVTVPVTSEDLPPADANDNGLPDTIESYLNIPAGAVSTRRTRRPTTSLQTPTPWRADNDLKVDTILVVNESADAFHSWQERGYRSWYMTGFRAGPDYVESQVTSGLGAAGPRWTPARLRPRQLLHGANRRPSASAL